MIKTLSKAKKSKNLAKSDNLTKSKKPAKVKNPELIKNKTFKTDFITFKSKIAFTKALILHYFDLKYYIRIESNTFIYAICGIFS